MSTIYVTREDVFIERLGDLSKALEGSKVKRTDLAEAISTAVGYAALSDIHDAFVTKARGGVDKLGIEWEPLAPSTIARRRVGPNDLKNNPEIKKRQKWVKKRAKELFDVYLLKHEAPKAKKIAESVAEREYTKLSGKTKIELLSQRTVEILRDTGVLLNSLTPGQIVTGAGLYKYEKPVNTGSQDQVFVVRPGSVTIGTKVAYADTHQEGTDHIPARPFLPRQEDKMPQEWIDNWKDAVTQCLIVMLPKYFRG